MCDNKKKGLGLAPPFSNEFVKNMNSQCKRVVDEGLRRKKKE